MRPLLKAIALFALPSVVGAQQGILSPGGPAGQKLTDLGWFVLWLSIGVAVVMWFLIGMLLTRPRGTLLEHAPADAGGGQNWILYGGFLFPAVVLMAMYVVGLNAMSEFPLNKGMQTPAQIRIVGHQWWWEEHYLYGPVHDHFVTANEVHIPVGKPVDIDLTSDDVIHSFWVPALHGKVDLIPGNMNRIRIEASHPGIFRGQCAEYCGEEHARMALLVVAQTPQDFEKWLERSRQPGVAPANPEQIAGEQVFMSGACSLCHTVDGTLAHGSVGPNLTHIGSRHKIAANWMDNDTANLSAWVTHARSLKPGVVMPNLSEFNGDQLRELVAYLQSLK